MLVRIALAGDELPEPPRAARRSDCASDPYPGAEKYGCLKSLASTRDVEGVLATLKASDLRGLGGAGFATELKWSLVRREPGPEKYIVCNADESEPGTIKDRFILTNLPYLVIEGMVLAGLVTGAQKGILYIRHEYDEQEHILAEELMRCRKAGLVGRGILGTDLNFDLEIFVSPGGYICGEESALLEAIEGKRAEPRNKPPFPVQQGLWGKPTVINNVETFANVPQILARGPEWYKSAGTNGASGLKFIGVSGCVRAARRFRGADGHAGVGIDFQARRRRTRRPHAQRFRAVRAVVGLFAGGDGGRAPGFQIARGGGLDAWLGRDGGLR